MSGPSFRELDRSHGPELLALNRACPIEADFTLYFDRSPDFFAWPSEVFERYRYLGIFQDGSLVGYVMAGSYTGWTGTGWGPAVYVGDARVRPDRRGQRLVERAFLQLEADHPSVDIGSFLIKKGNLPAQRLAATAGPARYRIQRLCRFDAFSILITAGGRTARRHRSERVRRARPDDVPELVDLFNDAYRGRLLAPKITAERLARRDEGKGALQLEDHYVAEVGGRIRGVLGLWDMGPLQRTTVLRYGVSATPLRAANALLRLVRPSTTPLPRPGESLRALTVTHLAIEEQDPLVLRALLDAAVDHHVGRGFHTVQIGFTQSDPLRRALAGLPRHRFSGEIYLLGPSGGAEPGSSASPPPYLDLSFI